MARSFLTPFFGGQSDPFLSLHREINRLFDDTLRETSSQSGPERSNNFIPPPINVAETEDEYRITAELPGLSQDQVDVRLDEDVLTIRGEKKFERKDDAEDYHLVERSYGTVQRSLRLPVRVDAEQVQASFDNGVLQITLPKLKALETSRRIEIRGGGLGDTRQLGRQGGNGESRAPETPHQPSKGSGAEGAAPPN